MPPSGMSRSIMSLSERRGFKQKEKGDAVIGAALPAVWQFVDHAGIDVALLFMWQRLLGEKKPFSCLSATVSPCTFVCVSAFITFPCVVHIEHMLSSRVNPKRSSKLLK